MLGLAKERASNLEEGGDGGDGAAGADPHPGSATSALTVRVRVRYALRIQRADEAKTGAIERDELRAAVALWYGHYAENAADEADGAQAEEEPASFGCCGLFGGSRGATVAPEP